MSKGLKREPMLDMFMFEAIQLLEQLEQIALKTEKDKSFDEKDINEIFRVMHTIKGSSAMMEFNSISLIAHSVEDLFYYLREEKPEMIDHTVIIDIVLCSLDFIKAELTKVEEGGVPDGEPSSLTDCIAKTLEDFKSVNQKTEHQGKKQVSEVPTHQKFILESAEKALGNINRSYESRVFFEDGCEMENIRAYTLMHNLMNKVEITDFHPQDILEREESKECIRESGFSFVFNTGAEIEDVEELFSSTPFIQSLELKLLKEDVPPPKKDTESIPEAKETYSQVNQEKKLHDVKVIESSNEQTTLKQSFISVNLIKLDALMDLVGELVITEAMVTKHPEILELELDGFTKASRQLSKLTSNLQDIVMSIRMVPLTATFQKMNRIVRDMSKKLNKEISLEISGEETDVDKNIIENISDPIMHIIRNSMDHGIESSQERISKNKSCVGKIILEAKNVGGEVWITIKDDGRGLDKEKILAKAKSQGLVKKPDSEITDREIYSYIFLPGFSTKDTVTEFSGRGVGMDVVVKNIEKLGGTVSVDSVTGEGSIFTIKIPLTLAIVEGMIITIGNSNYIVPTTSIKECFKLDQNSIIRDSDGNEMMMIRANCYSILRLNQFFKIDAGTTELEKGIFIMIENDYGTICLFADALKGEQQVVVKALPKYMRKVKGVSGCTLLGDGSVSLILDSDELINSLI